MKSPTNGIAKCILLPLMVFIACKEHQEPTSRSEGTSRQAAHTPQPSNDPCTAQNPIGIFTSPTMPVDPLPSLNPSEHNIEVATSGWVCLLVRTPEPAQKPLTVAIEIANQVLFEAKQLTEEHTTAQWSVYLEQGTYRLSFSATSTTPSFVVLQAVMAGPKVSRMSVVAGEANTQIWFEGEGFTSPLTIRSGTIELQNVVIVNPGLAHARTVQGMSIRPLTITTPLGSTETQVSFVPFAPPNFAQIYPRFPEQDVVGDGEPDITEVRVIEDGVNVAVVVVFANPLPQAASISFAIRRGYKHMQPTTYSGGSSHAESFPDGAQLAVGDSTASLVMPLVLIGTHDPEWLGLFWLKVMTSTPQSIPDVFPDFSPLLEWAEYRPIAAARYLRYRAEDPALIAARYLGEYIGTVEHTDLSLMRIAPWKTLEEALKELIMDPDARGAFLEPVLYAAYSPTRPGGTLWTGNCGVSSNPVDTFPPGPVVPQWELWNAQVPEAWGNVAAGNPTGSGVKIIIADSGISAHEEFPGAKFDSTLSRSFLIGFGVGNPFEDPDGHGTRVASVAAAHSSNGGIAGVAPGAQLISYRIAYGNGLTTGFSVSSAISTARDAQDADPSVLVLNVSFVESPFWRDVAAGVLVSGALLNASWFPFALAVYYFEMEIAKETAQRLLVTASAGNSRNKWYHFYGSSYPATVSGVLSVGAIDSNNVATNFTTRDSTVGIAAPGLFVTVADTESSTALACDDGTSFSAPMVAGAGAVVLSVPGVSANPQLVRAILKQTAIPTGDPADLVGAGRLNLAAAVQEAVVAHRRFAAFSGVTWVLPLVDTTFVDDEPFALLPGGVSVAPEPSVIQGDYVGVSVSGGPYEWIVGDARIGNSDVLLLGKPGHSSVAVVHLTGSVATTTHVPVPGVIAGKAMVVRGPPPAQPRFALVPLSSGLVSISLHDPAFHVEELVVAPLSFQGCVAGTAFLSGTKIRVACEQGTGPVTIALYAFDVLRNSIALEQVSEPISASGLQMVVARTRIGPSADFSVIATDGTGLLYRVSREPFHAFAPVVTSFASGVVRPYKGLIASPTDDHFFAFTENGFLAAINPVDFVKRYEVKLPPDLVLKGPSISSSGSRLFFSNALAKFNANDPNAPPKFEAIYVLNP
jgi:hypothetical protein